jgi:hypothetical protein
MLHNAELPLHALPDLRDLSIDAPHKEVGTLFAVGRAPPPALARLTALSLRGCKDVPIVPGLVELSLAGNTDPMAVNACLSEHDWELCSACATLQRLELHRVRVLGFGLTEAPDGTRVMNYALPVLLGVTKAVFGHVTDGIAGVIPLDKLVALVPFVADLSVQLDAFQSFEAAVHVFTPHLRVVNLLNEGARDEYEGECLALLALHRPNLQVVSPLLRSSPAVCDCIVELQNLI